MTSFYTLSDILRAILSCNKEVCCVVFIFEWRIALEGLDRWIGFQFVCINRLDGAVASADRVTFGERFFLTASFDFMCRKSYPKMNYVCFKKYPKMLVFGRV